MTDLPNESDTLAFGARLAKLCPQPFILFLQGELGSGKTTLVRGFLRGFNYASNVKSPTYTLVEPYSIAGQQIFHFDLYRLNDPEEIENLGIGDYFTPTSICLIEWPERAKNLLPTPDLSCYIQQHDTGRRIQLIAHSAKAKVLIEQLKKCG